jgi:hypothetical protein
MFFSSEKVQQAGSLLVLQIFILSGCQQAGRRLYIFGSSEKVQQAASLLVLQIFILSGSRAATWRLLRKGAAGCQPAGSSNFHSFRVSTGWQPVVHLLGRIVFS